MLLAVGTFPRTYLLLFALANALAALRCVAGALVPAWRPRRRGFPGSPVLSAWACYGIALFSVALCLASLTEAGELAGMLPWRLWILAVGILALLAGLAYEHTRRPRP